MKVCSTCLEDLPKESFSKKQWQLKRWQRRCIGCIETNRVVDSKVSGGGASTQSIKLLQDDDIFKETPKEVECPICFLTLPIGIEQSCYLTCCGKLVCYGCVVGVHDRALEERNVKFLCPFCREPLEKSDREQLNSMKKRVECGDCYAFFEMGRWYESGSFGMPLDLKMANQMYLRAGELGCARGYCIAGDTFRRGLGVAADTKKARKYYELAIKGGSVWARHNLGCLELEEHNFDRAIKHLTISARDGHESSLPVITHCYKYGAVSKDEYEKTLRAFQKSNDCMRSDLRSKAKRMAEQA